MYRLIYGKGAFTSMVLLDPGHEMAVMWAMRDGLRAAGYNAILQSEREWVDVEQ